MSVKVGVYNIVNNATVGTAALDPASVLVSSNDVELTVDLGVVDGTVDVSASAVGVYTFDASIADINGLRSDDATYTVTAIADGTYVLATATADNLDADEALVHVFSGAATPFAVPDALILGVEI